MYKKPKFTLNAYRDIFKTRTLHKSPTQSDEMSLQKSDENIKTNEVLKEYFFLLCFNIPKMIAGN